MVSDAVEQPESKNSSELMQFLYKKTLTGLENSSVNNRKLQQAVSKINLVKNGI